MKSALLAGGTGLIGKQLLELLLSSDQYSTVTAISRTPLGRNHEKLQNLIGNYTDLNRLLTNGNPDDVFCCLGTTMAKAGSKANFYEVDYHYPLSLAKAALRVGAKQFLLVSSMGADKNSAIYYNRVKGELEESLRSINMEATHIFRPSLLLGSRGERRAGEDVAKFLSGVFWFAIPKKYRAIPGEKVAKAMLAFASKNQQGFFIHESDEMQHF